MHTTHSNTQDKNESKHSEMGVEQRAPPMFGRATITLGIGPHF